MSPYQSLISNPLDILIAWAFVALWLSVGTSVLYSWDSVKGRIEPSMFWAAERTFLWLSLLFDVIFAFGLVFLAWLRVASGFWFVWELLWSMSTICVFRVLPLIVLALVGWLIIDSRRHGARRFAIFIAMACPVALAINVALYFILEAALKQ